MNPEIEERAKEVFAEVMMIDFDGIDAQTSPATIPAWTSFNHLTLMSAIEEAFEVQFSMEEMSAVKDFGTLVSAIESRKA